MEKLGQKNFSSEKFKKKSERTKFIGTKVKRTDWKCIPETAFFQQRE